MVSKMISLFHKEFGEFPSDRNHALLVEALSLTWRSDFSYPLGARKDFSRGDLVSIGLL